MHRHYKANELFHTSTYVWPCMLVGSVDSAEEGLPYSATELPSFHTSNARTPLNSSDEALEQSVGG